jgi:hypothetical protein
MQLRCKVQHHRGFFVNGHRLAAACCSVDARHDAVAAAVRVFFCSVRHTCGVLVARQVQR